MKKFLGISLVFAMFLTMGTNALAAEQNCTPNRVCSYYYSQSCNTGSNSQLSNTDFWQQLLNKLGWQQAENTGSQQPTTPTTPDTPDNEETTGNVNTDSSYAAQVAELVNRERAKQGLNPVTLDEEISAAATVRAKEAAQSFSHTRPNGSYCFTALKEAGISYRGAGENIAYGQSTPAAVMTDWMNSSGHRANILNAKYTKIGVGYTVINGTAYWAQFFTY